jgi:hypothetical protein
VTISRGPTQVAPKSERDAPPPRSTTEQSAIVSFFFITLGLVHGASVIDEGLPVQGLRPEEVKMIDRFDIGDRLHEPLAIKLVLDPREDGTLVVVDVVILVDVEGLRTVLVRPLSVFVS